MTIARAGGIDGSMAAPRRGDLYVIPAGEAWHKDKKPRYHVAAVVPTLTGLGSAFYVSWSGAQEVNGTPCEPIKPRSSGPHANRLREQSNVYPAIVRPVAKQHLKDFVGRTTPEELDKILSLVPSAFGFTEGNCYRAGVARGSLRGKIVQLQPSVARRAGSSFGVVLSPHSYSVNREGFLTIVPLALATEPDAEAGDILLEDAGITFAELVRTLPAEAAQDTPDDSAVVLAREPFAIDHELVARRFSLVMPDSVLARIEASLTIHFGLNQQVAVAS